MPNIQSYTSYSRRSVVALCTALAANACGHTFILIVMPTLGRQLGFGDIQTGLLIGLSALLLALSGPILGIISDRKGRRRVIVIALLGAASFPLILAWLSEMRLSGIIGIQSTYFLLLAARTAQVSISGGLMPATQAWLADHTATEKRASAMALMGASFGLGSIVGGTFAWWFGADHLVLALCLITAVIIATAIWVLSTVKDRPEAQNEPSFNSTDSNPNFDAPSFSISSLLPFLAVTLCGLATYGLLHQVTPLRLQDVFGLSANDAIAQSGKIMSFTLLGLVIMQFLVARKLGWSPARLMQTGSITALLAIVVILFSPSIPFLTVATMVLGMSLGILIPGNLAKLSLTAGPAAQARAAGINAIAQGIGMALGPAVGAFLHQLAPVAPYGLACALIATIVVMSFLPAKKAPFTI